MLSRDLFSPLRHLERLPGASPHPLPRALLAAALRGASRLLARGARMARQLAHVRRDEAHADPVYEFYAEAGAPEGAVYVDGRLVGHLPGVSRL
jgi:hypothetical protein